MINEKPAVYILKMPGIIYLNSKTSMKQITVILFSFFLFASSCTNSKQDAAEAEKESYEKAMAALEEKERKNPALFLSVSSNEKQNLLGQTVVRGSVTNNAKVCIYKDVQLEVSFFSKTGTLLEKGNETVYEEIHPGKSNPFKFKNFAPKGTGNIVIKVIGAKTE